MSAKVVALAGASGYVGKAIANALLNTKVFDLRLLSRPSSLDSALLQEFKGRGASLHGISYDDQASIVTALQGVDVLISTVAFEGLVSAQTPLIKAAKAAGVKLFFPSEFAVPFEGENPPPRVAQKKVALEVAKKEGLPVAIVNHGVFPEYTFIPPVGINFAEKKVTIWGDGNTKVNWTPVDSVGSWVAGALKTHPIEKLQGGDFRITSQVATLNEVVKIWEQKHNDKLQVEYRPIKELDERLAANPGDLFALISKLWALGLAHFTETGNKFVPDWKPATLEDVL